MTALTMPARPKHDAGLRPVPWRRMGWVTWRQHRIALAGVAALLGTLGVYVWIVELQLHHAYAVAVACHPAYPRHVGTVVRMLPLPWVPACQLFGTLRFLRLRDYSRSATHTRTPTTKVVTLPRPPVTLG